VECTSQDNKLGTNTSRNSLVYEMMMQNREEAFRARVGHHPLRCRCKAVMGVNPFRMTKGAVTTEMMDANRCRTTLRGFRSRTWQIEKMCERNRSPVHSLAFHQRLHGKIIPVDIDTLVFEHNLFLGDWLIANKKLVSTLLGSELWHV
jgi:hypothetical protein